jgi:triosephosphate isomerase (TIM)
MRRLFIAGNWKMHNTIADSIKLAEALIEAVGAEDKIDVGIAPVYTALSSVATKSLKSNIHLLAQNMHNEAKGAFTGEISAEMLTEIGVKYVILGHSERRHVFGETDELINKKVITTFENDLLPILCIGETQEERESDKTIEVVDRQLSKGLEGVSAEQFAGSVLAYEPVWAIGTGLTASPEQAQDIHAHIRSWLADRFNSDIADQTRIQYGGSVKPDNVAGLVSKPDIDGGLIGGASLKVDSFVGIIRNALGG